MASRLLGKLCDDRREELSLPLWGQAQCGDQGETLCAVASGNSLRCPKGRAVLLERTGERHGTRLLSQMANGIFVAFPAITPKNAPKMYAKWCCHMK